MFELFSFKIKMISWHTYHLYLFCCSLLHLKVDVQLFSSSVCQIFGNSRQMLNCACISWLCFVCVAQLKHPRHWANWWKLECWQVFVQSFFCLCLNEASPWLSLIMCLYSICLTVACRQHWGNTVEVFLSSWRASISRHIIWEELCEIKSTWKLQ